MNEFVAKKMGEVVAFERIGIETMERTEAAFMTIFGAEQMGAIVERRQHRIRAVLGAAEEAGIAEVTNAKAEKTAQKLTNMRDMYIGDEWENEAEIAEWLGFFEGAAWVHWSLVEGAAEARGLAALTAVATEAVTEHQNLLNAVSAFLHARGKSKAA